MSRRPILILLVGALVLAGSGYFWWARPERQIRAILSHVEEALSPEPGEGTLETLAGVTELERLLAAEVSVQRGDAPPFEGRDEVVTAAARYRTYAARNATIVRFLDARIVVNGEEGGEETATVALTAEVRPHPSVDGAAVEVYDVEGILRRSEEGRWLITWARGVARGVAPEARRQAPHALAAQNPGGRP